ncbi:uncharacterized protein LAESUDRAFT_291273 [Laetiporus sulphureus 93-53]|uniref:Uncharacterized protein n=1 Tax=Laetiporus sulphureus 93-53 TaxID=1314785 RepID=A0A165DE22_9APHY|nr:uncharacterized protein LAESUDRAFT_291273 [Laetiporus sulphureus 93-53]KZT04677.1 hypothetical protein LAESUDRAFT_291273 [Laetiporus sulphureus 93-53]
MRRVLHFRFSARYRSKVLFLVNTVCGTIAVITTLAILWHKLYSHHRLAATDLLSTSHPSLAALLLRDGTIQLTTILLLNLLHTLLELLGLSILFIIGDLECSLTSVLISRILLNIRAAARSTRGEQSQTPSFVRSQRALQTEADVENMSFELNVLGSTEQAPETDHPHVQDSTRHDQIIAEPRSMVNNVVTAGDAHQDMNEEEGMDGVEEEMQSDWEDEE